MKHIAFALDPDGYWVEIIGQKPIEETADIKETDVTTYRMVRGDCLQCLLIFSR
jgi:lactoylglutathione lyase